MFDGGAAHDQLFLSALQELTAYAAAEATRLELNNPSSSSRYTNARWDDEAETFRHILAAAGIAVAVQGLPPSAEHARAVDRFNAALRPDIVLPFATSDLRHDGIHLNAAGYSKWRDAIAPMVKANC